jgi:iron complex outermembrane receptor protein
LLVPRFKLGTGEATLGGGVQHVGERLGDVAASTDFTLPGYTTAKLIASYAPNPTLRLSLNIDNLFNRTYYASSYSQAWVAPGAERNITFNLYYRFQ